MDMVNTDTLSVDGDTLCGTVSLHELPYTIIPLNTIEIAEYAPHTLSRRWKILETKLHQIYRKKGEGFFCNTGHLVELRDYMFIAFGKDDTVAGFATIEPFVLRDGWQRASWSESFDNEFPKKIQIEFLESYVKGMGRTIIKFAKYIARSKRFGMIEAPDILPGSERFWEANGFSRGFPDRYSESITFFKDMYDDPWGTPPLEFDGAYFRLNKPYGLYMHESQPITVPFNRFYCSLGSTRDHAVCPTGYRCVYLYTDGTCPWLSLENHTQYEKTFAELMPDDDVCRICDKSCAEKSSCSSRYHVAEGEWLDPKPDGYVGHWVPLSQVGDYGTTIAYCDECCDKHGGIDVDSVVLVRGARFLIRDTQRYND